MSTSSNMAAATSNQVARIDENHDIQEPREPWMSNAGPGAAASASAGRRFFLGQPMLHDDCIVHEILVFLRLHDIFNLAAVSKTHAHHAVRVLEDDYTSFLQNSSYLGETVPFGPARDKLTAAKRRRLLSHHGNDDSMLDYLGQLLMRRPSPTLWYTELLEGTKRMEHPVARIQHFCRIHRFRDLLGKVLTFDVYVYDIDGMGAAQRRFIERFREAWELKGVCRIPIKTKGSLSLTLRLLTKPDGAHLSGGRRRLCPEMNGTIFFDERGCESGKYAPPRAVGSRFSYRPGNYRPGATQEGCCF